MIDGSCWEAISIDFKSKMENDSLCRLYLFVCMHKINGNVQFESYACEMKRQHMNKEILNYNID